MSDEMDVHWEKMLQRITCPNGCLAIWEEVGL